MYYFMCMLSMSAYVGYTCVCVCGMSVSVIIYACGVCICVFMLGGEFLESVIYSS